MAENLAVVLLGFLGTIVNLYQWVIIAAVIFSWLINFNVINPHNGFVRSLLQAVSALTEPLLRPIRRALPDMGGLDISPIILLLGCLLVQNLIYGVAIPAVRGV